MIEGWGLTRNEKTKNRKYSKSTRKAAAALSPPPTLADR